MELTSVNKLLTFKDELTGLSFRIELRDRITIILGDSATGKTLLVSTMRKVKQGILSNNDFDDSALSSVYIFSDNDLVDSLKVLNNKIIVIDRADIVFNVQPSLMDLIKFDYNNQYIIIGRGNFDLDLTPNNFATLKTIDGVVLTDYSFNEKGW